MPRFIKWDYDANTATEFERTGECNGCGACCRAYIAYESPQWQEPLPDGQTAPDAPNGLHFTSGVGVWFEYESDGVRRFWRFTEMRAPHAACPQLSDDNRCAEHLTKRMICAGFPFAPENITLFPDCSFEFVTVNTWEIEPR